MVRKIHFYFDYISHNAYIAWTQLPKLEKTYDVTFKAIPVLFGAFLKHNGVLGPAEVPPKNKWMAKDVIRKAKRLGVPFSPPASHPFNPLLSLRATCAIPTGSDPNTLIDALFKATWAESRDITQSEVVAKVADGVGFDGAHLVAQTQDPMIKRKLIENTQNAIELGVFGVPTMVIDEEIFWGYDDFPHLELYLNGEDPFNPAEFEAWMQVKPSIQRK